jgi:hypothetical protein
VSSEQRSSEQRSRQLSAISQRRVGSAHHLALLKAGGALAFPPYSYYSYYQLSAIGCQQL